jgi:thiol-disulfide isomerase/thioredoxin
VIDFWATWCAPCKKTSPIFEYQASRYKYQNEIVFLSANVDEDKNKWKLDIKNKKSSAVQWWIANRDALASIGINGIPRFMIIDQEGKIYNANLPMPDDSNFVDIIDKISNSWRKKIDF